LITPLTPSSYLSFHPVVYLSKLQIEMKMAELITKLVRSTGGRGNQDVYYIDNTNSDSHSVVNDKRSNPNPPVSTDLHEDVELGSSEDAESHTGQTAVERDCVLEAGPLGRRKSMPS
jgi:hypothetical protein